MIPYLRKGEIRRNALEVLGQYQKRRGNRVQFPIDCADVFSVVFGLDTVFDTEGVLNAMDKRIIGCLYPDGHPSPWGRDKLIVVNASKEADFDPSVFNENFTAAHEGIGHYVHHFLKGIINEKIDRPVFCRSSDYSPLEWQANFAAGELTQPFEQLVWILDGKKPPEIINVELYGYYYKEYFGANQAMMETRLHSLGYRLINGKYPWASYLTMEKKAGKELEKKLRASQELRKQQDEFTARFSGFTDLSSIFSDLRTSQYFGDLSDFFWGKKK